MAVCHREHVACTIYSRRRRRSIVITITTKVLGKHFSSMYTKFRIAIGFDLIHLLERGWKGGCTIQLLVV